jgi:integrase/recombinase XerD
LGKATGDTVNNALRAKISALDYEGRIGTMQIYEQTLRITEEFAGTNISFSSITVQWLRKCKQFWLQTKNKTTTSMHFRKNRTAKKSQITNINFLLIFLQIYNRVTNFEKALSSNIL